MRSLVCVLIAVLGVPAVGIGQWLKLPTRKVCRETRTARPI